MPEVQLVREWRERGGEEEREEERGGVVHPWVEWKGRNSLALFFFFWEGGGANQLRFRVVVQLLRGGVVPPSSSPSFSFSNCNTEPERYWCQRFGCCCFFSFFQFSFRGEGQGFGSVVVRLVGEED